MRFERISDGLIFDAKCWQRHGDVSVVRPATSVDLPTSSSPGAYGWIDGSGIVLPGDYVLIDANDRACVVLERTFRQNYRPSPFKAPDA